MKIFIALFASLFLSIIAHAAEPSPIYPFKVTIDGKVAEIVGDPTTAIFAKIADPVPADALLEVEGEPGMIIINVFPTNEAGEVVSGAAPAILMAQDTTKIKLDQTMDKSKIAPGLYLANIVYKSGTSRVMFTVK